MKYSEEKDKQQQVELGWLTCLFKVLDCDLVDRKKADSSIVLWAHVGDGGSVRCW